MHPVKASTSEWPTPGTIVWTPAYVFWRHKGIVSDRWHAKKPMVISGSVRAGHVQEEPWDEFSQGNDVFVQGYPGELPSYEVLRRARERIGTLYRLLDWNCEHVVAHAHGFKPQSPQVVTTLLAGVIALSIVAAARKGL